MTLPDEPMRILPVDTKQLKPAYLIRFSDVVWTQLEALAASGEDVSISMEDGMKLNIPGQSPIPLTVQPSGATSEIHFATSDTLAPHALASSRLVLPLGSVNNSKAADRLKAKNDAHDKERKERAERMNGTKKAIPRPIDSSAVTMSRGLSSPALPSTPNPGSSVPVVPLKTRVIQLLALGPCRMEDIVSRVGMSEGEVLRVVRVVGRETPDGYTLQPSKYSQVKVGSWNYTYKEKMRVIALAKAAFDELELPQDADERADLDRKEAEVTSGGSSSSEKIETPPPAPTPIPTPQVASASTPPKKEKGAKKTGLSLIGKQKAKFAAEKRASSLPNVKKMEGTASPRASSPHIPPTDSKSSPMPPARDEDKPTKRKREDADGPPKKKNSPQSVNRGLPPKPKRAPSPATTSSSEEPRGRSKTAKVGPKIEREDTKPKRSREYSSSGDSSDDRPDHKSKSVSSRKPPPPELKLNGHREEHRDPEALRERYEELFPAYQQLSDKLARLYQDAAGEEEGEVVEMDQNELAKMVARFEKWHKELEGIRRYFTA